MFFTGRDLHKRRITLHQMDEDQAHGLHDTVPTTPEDLSRCLDQLHDPTMITFEASGGYYWLSQLFENHPMVAGVHVVDPRRSRRIAEELSVQAD